MDREPSRHASSEKQAKRFFVSGRVQGVGYRFFVQEVADRLRLSGYVKNLFDGRVEVYAVGSAPELEALKGELRRGPRFAFVESVDDEDAPVETRFAAFSIEDS